MRRRASRWEVTVFFDFARAERPPTRVKRRRGTCGRGSYKPGVESLEKYQLLSTLLVTRNDVAVGLEGEPLPGTLRFAIIQANIAGDSDQVDFALPVDPANREGSLRIQPTSELPAIIQPLTIDGTTQPGFKADDPKPIVELNGDQTTGGSGLSFGCWGCTVRGLVINGFKRQGDQLFNGGCFEYPPSPILAASLK
jgi:hypothetical protein